MTPGSPVHTICLLTVVALAAFASPSLHSQSNETSPQVELQVKYYGSASPYLNDSIRDLRKAVPTLDGLKPAKDQQPLADILSKTSANLDRLLDHLPDLVAEESVTQMQWRNAQDAVAKCTGMSGCLDPVPSLRTNEKFSYIILPHRASEHHVRLEEYRTTLNDEPVKPGDEPHFQGFASFWIIFSSSNLAEAHFRFLGQQKRDGHAAYVVAFAQIPGSVNYNPRIVTRAGSVPMLLQGIAWIDRTNFQLVRLHTNLLAPQPEIAYKAQTSSIKFGRARIPALALDLWLPEDVRVETEVQGQLWQEHHRYSSFRLYQAKSKIILSPPS